MKQYQKKQIYFIIGTAFFFLAGGFLLFFAKTGQRVYAAEKEHETVKVGFYPVANYQEVREDGTYNGFSYDYFMQIQKYTRWDYDFVEASYADCMKMLMTGEIDVMSGMGKTDEREQQVIFSKYSISSSQNKLYARNDNQNLFYESFDAFDGCKVAMMRGMLTDELQEYCTQHKFRAEIVTYDSLQEMETALLSGDVDMVCASSITNDIDTKIVGRLDKQPLYFATTKKRPEIAQELDEALRKIVDNNPNFYTQMSEKYMISGANATATFTKEEMEYIKSGKKAYIIVNANWAPITWYDKESGEYRGIFIDVIRKIEEYSGMQFALCTEDEFNEMAKEQPDMVNNVIAILADDNSWAVQQNVMMTNHVEDASVVMVTRRGVRKEELEKNQKIALPNRFYIGYVMREELKGKNVVYYDTVQDCLDAVNSGKADLTYVNELVANYYLSMLEYSNLFATANTGYYENLAFAVNKDSEAPLLSILDKSLLCLGTTEIEQIVVQNSIAEERFSLKGLYYSKPYLVFVIVGLSIFVLFAIAFVIFRTMDKRRQTEAELEKEFETNNARTEFFMMISHELRTPLNAISGYLSLVAEECKKNGWGMEYIKRSQNAAKQLADIAEDMLDYTRIASESVELESELFDLKDVVRNVDQNLSLRVAKKDLEYRFRVHDISHEYVVGDGARVTQIIQNILSNAIKFTDAGGKIDAKVSERLLEDEKVEMTFTCKDTGRGMSAEFLEKVCAPFNQSDRAYSRTHGGLGLGLYLTKYFVNIMHGTFSVESQLGEGSCFTVTIPLELPHSEQLLENNISCAHVRAILGGESAEENEQLKQLLKRLKIKSDAVTDPGKLLKRVQSRMGGDYAYSLCILDEDMMERMEAAKLPGENGCAWKKSVAEEIMKLEHPPIIFVMTSHLERVDALQKQKGIAKVLYKPIFQSVLFDAVMNTFGGYEVEKESQPERFEGIHAMIVEDNVVNADILTRILKKANVEVTICANGALAVEEFEQAKKGTYQIIFMDIQMPVMDGYEATRRIRNSENPQGAVIPIIAVSANAFPEDIEASKNAGMNRHLSKPVDAVKLSDAIKTYCE